MRVYCPYCKKEVEYKIEKRDLKEFRGIEINTNEKVAICKECNDRKGNLPPFKVEFGRLCKLPQK